MDEGFDTNDIPYDVIWLDIELGPAPPLRVGEPPRLKGGGVVQDFVWSQGGALGRGGGLKSRG